MASLSPVLGPLVAAAGVDPAIEVDAAAVAAPAKKERREKCRLMGTPRYGRWVFPIPSKRGSPRQIGLLF
jgi:hypothetical protein